MANGNLRAINIIRTINLKTIGKGRQCPLGVGAPLVNRRPAPPNQFHHTLDTGGAR